MSMISADSLAAAFGLSQTQGRLGRLRLKTLTLIRWIGIAGQLVAVLLTRFGFGIPIPLLPLLIAIAASALLNIWCHVALRGGRLNDQAAAAFLGFDIVQLAVLLYLTGGVLNPFSMLFLAPVTVAATALSRESVAALALLAIAAVIALTFRSWPLPVEEGLYRIGVSVALIVSSLFIAAYVSRVVAEGRRLSDALTATQLALAREQRVSALGGLAAAAAHELGSPLSTIAVVARELQRDLPPDSPLAEDVALLLSETARCRDILAELSARPEPGTGTPFDALPVRAFLEEAARPWLAPEIGYEITGGGRDSSPSPRLHRSPEMLHGLGNLLQNAFQFAASRVEAAISWDRDRLEIEIRDDGPGYPPGLLAKVGDPYISTRAGTGEHLGLGIFIASTLLHRTGASLRFFNGEDADGTVRGARVHISWPRHVLETPPLSG